MKNLNNYGKVFGILIIAIALFFLIRRLLLPASYRLDYSEGSCSFTKNTCEWAGEHCGGGHGICTNNPDLHNGGGGICDINMKFPANQGYSCTCLAALGKCGWAK